MCAEICDGAGAGAGICDGALSTCSVLLFLSFFLLYLLQMWFLKNSKELLENLKVQSLHSVNSIKSFDFSTLYTTIPHDK